MNHEADLIELVRRLKGEGARNTEIAQVAGVSYAKVVRLCHTHQIRRPQMAEAAEVQYLMDGPRRVNEGRLHLPLGPRLVQALQAEAASRKQPLVPFIARLLRHTVEDNLFSAILDDGK